jgi:alkylhydroperoxidase/carboxymuconolactone decarboxylase family protein YurZ
MSKPPTFYMQFRDHHPAIVKAYEALGDACRAAGPLAEKHAELVKLGLAAGAGLEGAIHSHARRALAAGATRDEVRHVGLLAITTLGFPGAMAIRAEIESVVAKHAKESRKTVNREKKPR